MHDADRVHVTIVIALINNLNHEKSSLLCCRLDACRISFYCCVLGELHPDFPLELLLKCEGI